MQHTLERLRTLYEHKHPFATVCIPAAATVEQAPQRLLIHWKHARAELSHHGVDEPTQAALEAAVEAHRPHGGSIVLIAAEGKVLVEETLPFEPDVAHVAVDGVPHVLSLIAEHQAHVPYLVVTVDRVGADIEAHVDGGVAAATSEDGSDENIHRSQPGGWSQRRYQQRAENRWEENAVGVANEVADWADRYHAELVVVAGDVRGVQFVREHLPARVLPLLREVEGARGDWSADRVAEQAAKLEASVAAERTVAVLHQFQEARANMNAYDTAASVIDMLRQRRVATLLVGWAARNGDERTAVLGTTPTEIALTAADLGSDGPTGLLTEACVRAAVAQNAAVRVVPSTGASVPDEGLGVILH